MAPPVTVKTLLKDSSKIKLKDKENYKLGLELLDACFDDIGYARFLIEKNNKIINWKDREYGNSILHSMVYSDSASQIKLLLSKGADVNIRNKNGETPLHWACKMSSVKATNILLNYSANINAIDNSGSSPLHCASASGLPEIILLLLEKGAKIQTQDKDGKTALDISMEETGDEFIAVSVLLQRNINAGNVKYVMNRQNSEDSFSIQHNKPLQSSSSLKSHQKISRSELIKSESVKNIRSNSFDFGEGELQNHDFNTPYSKNTKENVVEKIKEKRIINNSIEINEKNELSINLPQAQLSDNKIKKSKSIRYFNETDPSLSKGNRRPHSASGNLFAVRKLEKPAIKGGPIPDSYNDQPSLTVDMTSQVGITINSPIKQKNVDNSLSLRKSTLSLPIEDSTITNRISKFFQPATYIPFLPSHPKHLDVFLSIEQCCDCDEHKWSLWHDEGRYDGNGNNILIDITTMMVSNLYPVRLYAYKVKPGRSRVGAFEVTLSVKIDNIKNEVETNEWITHVLHSKLATSSWPLRKDILKSATNFMSKLLSETDSMTQSLDISKAVALKQEINILHTSWQQRLNIKIGEVNNVIVVNSLKNPSFLKLPNTIESSSVQALKKWEKETLDYFFVLDNSASAQSKIKIKIDSMISKEETKDEITSPRSPITPITNNHNNNHNISIDSLDTDISSPVFLNLSSK